MTKHFTKKRDELYLNTHLEFVIIKKIIKFFEKIIAQLQHIVYNEFLPLITGDNSLAPLNTSSYYDRYDSTINAALYNEFGTAAFRMGHSLIRQASGRFDVNNNQLRGGNYNFQSIVFQSDFAYRYFF